MNKSLISLTLSLLSITSVFSQNEQDIRTALKDISSLNQVDSLKSAFPDWDIKVNRTVAQGFFSDSAVITSDIGEMCNSSDINNKGIFVYKIIDKKKEKHCSVRYIFFHGTNRTMQELDSIRSVVLEQYAQGADFTALHSNYNEDGSETGFLDWFCKGIMVKEFDQAVFPKRKNEIFTVDVPRLNWHYIVLKPYKNKEMIVTYSIKVRIKN